ncbi:MAG: FAD binding domain-containing protein [Bacteriovoracaceae bacterium]|nr:FAD binding domain-containing protein [Bacteriovoracaceae bacterium]
MRNKIVFYLNGNRKEVGPREASMMLAEYLRYDQGLTGTKIVCAEGDCGACSVLRLFPHLQGTDNQNYLPINSCITLVAQLDGSSIVTVDALKKDNELHETQKAMVACHGSQCGFCTPGFVMTITGLVEEKLAKKETSIDVQEAKNCMTGNLCRCTGYQPIVNATIRIDLNKCHSIKERFYSEKQEVDLTKVYSESVLLESDEFFYFAPKTMKEALNYLKDYPDTKIIASATDLGVVHNKRKTQLARLLSLHLISDLYKVQLNGNEVKIGARVTHTEFRHFMKDKLPEFANYLDIFASPQIKNIGTVIGNIANASPIGDTPPAFLALNATICVTGPQGEREIPITKFFLAYRKIALEHGDIITAVKFNLPSKNSTVRFYKNSNRKDLDISAVNFAIKVDWKDESKKEILDVAIAAGGIAATPLRLTKTETFLKQNFDIEGAVKELHSEFNPLSDVRASSAYRHVLMENFLRRFFAEAGGIQ